MTLAASLLRFSSLRGFLLSRSEQDSVLIHIDTYIIKNGKTRDGKQSSYMINSILYYDNFHVEVSFRALQSGVLNLDRRERGHFSPQQMHISPCPQGACNLRSLSYMHTYEGQFRQEPIDLPACLWYVGGNRSTRRKPTQAQGAHADSLQIVTWPFSLYSHKRNRASLI